MTRSSRRAPFDRTLVRGVLVALGVGVFLTFSGAFQTHELSFAERLTYWMPIMFVGAIWGYACSRMADRFVDSDRRPWATAFGLTAIISGPLAVAVWLMTGLIVNDGRLLAAALPVFFLPVAVVTLAISLINVFMERRPVQTHAAPAGAPTARFPDRLPVKLRGATIRAVEAEDHYLRVHTDRGSDLILMRLSDALAELEGLEGAQTHRSWWVAREAVTDVSRGDGRATLTLAGGLEVPVSRRYARALRTAGWW